MLPLNQYILESRTGDTLRELWRNINWGDKQVRKDLNNIGIGDAMYKEKSEIIYFEDSSKFVRRDREYWVEKLPQSFINLFNKYAKKVEKEGLGELWMEAHENTNYYITIGIDK